MITVRLKVISYNKETNTCSAQLLNGDIIELDPFVSCAIYMTDEEYTGGEGFKIVGNNYLLTSYTVHPEHVVPHEGGMIAL